MGTRLVSVGVVECDVDGCDRNLILGKFDGSESATVAKTKALAKGHGWGYNGSVCLCPKHANYSPKLPPYIARTRVAKLRLCDRTYTALMSLNLHTLNDLLWYTPEGLRSLSGLGDKSCYEIERAVAKMGLSLGAGMPKLKERKDGNT